MPNEDRHTIDVDLGGRRQRKMPIDYPSNSKTAKVSEPEKKRTEKIEGLTVTKREQGIASKLMKNFISEDSHTVGSYVLLEVLLPAFKNMVVEAGNQALERIFYGDRPRRSTDVRSGYINYQRASEPRVVAPRTLSQQARTSHRFDEWEFPTRAMALEVIDKLQLVLDEYPSVSVADLYEIIGVTGEFTDNKWGWTSLSGANVRAARGGGFYLELPPTKSLA
jgi:hypothetical protein